MKSVIEATYPLSFRSQEAKALGEHLTFHNSVVIIGMKRVGISNFLRFFLYHEGVEKEYIKSDLDVLFVTVDLNDLIERELYPFWTLVLKRLVDTAEKDGISSEALEETKRLFTESIQLKDLFFTVDAVRKIIERLSAEGKHVTLFLIRFDRLKDAVTAEFFGNLQSLKDAANQHMSYVFTSFRPLHHLSPDIFKKSSLSVFSHEMYLKPAIESDMRTILDTFLTRYQMSLPETVATKLLQLSVGHVQYLHLALMRLKGMETLPKNLEELVPILTGSEEMTLLSEELYESLSATEKEVLLAVQKTKSADDSQKQAAKYLWDTGIIRENQVFSPLFEDYLARVNALKQTAGEFTKKEHALFMFLKGKEGELCEREEIIHIVWPESEELGVSDWSVDRLVARLRAKMKAQSMQYEIVTVITRGYKLLPRTG